MRYESSEEVEADMKLVFDNAIKYNPPGHPIHMQVSLLPRARRREWAMKRSGGEHGGWVWHSLLILSLALVHLCTRHSALHLSTNVRSTTAAHTWEANTSCTNT
jgi:hypothetical protein